MNILGFIPVRMGSQRLPRKNYLQLGDMTVAEHAVSKAISANIFDRVVLASDDPDLRPIADKYSIEFYFRNEHTASNNATSDIVFDDIMANFECDAAVWVNTASPLQTVNDIRSSVIKFKLSDANCFVAVNEIKTHCYYQNYPLNFKYDEAFAKTQDLHPVLKYVYSTMGWRKKPYVQLRKNGFKGLFDETCLHVVVSEEAGILLKNKNNYEIIKNIFAQENINE